MTREDCTKGCEELESFAKKKVEEAGGWESWPECTLKLVYTSKTAFEPEQAMTQRVLLLLKRES